MASGELREQIQDILDNGGDIPTSVQNRLILAAHRETHGLVKDMHEFLFGDGGLVSRVERNEDRHENNKWFQRIVVGAVIVDIIARFLPPQ